MTVDDYRRNLRGVNEKTDFSQEYLVSRLISYLMISERIKQQNIYDSIRKREIVMPEEHLGRVGFEYAWKELLTRTRQTGKVKLDSHSIILYLFRPVHDLQHSGLRRPNVQGNLETCDILHCVRVRDV